MKFMLFSLLAVLLAAPCGGAAAAAENQAVKVSDIETLLSTYLQNRLKLAVKQLQTKQSAHESGIVTLPDVLAAENEVDRYQFQLRLATDGKLIALHPVLNELRREFGIPETTKTLPTARRQAVSQATRDYLQRRLHRAEKLLESARLRHEMGRTTASEVFSASSEVEGLKLLLAVENLNSPEASK
jgi:hypothetical protein